MSSFDFATILLTLTIWSPLIIVILLIVGIFLYKKIRKDLINKVFLFPIIWTM